MRPVIAFTSSRFQSVFSKLAIRFAINLAGGKPLSILPHSAQSLPDFDGLLLGGGVDIHPQHYQGDIKSGYCYDAERDAIEIQLLKQAFELDKPVLGICRGCQMLNIFRNGTLHEDITKMDDVTMYPSHLLGYIFFRKNINIVPNSQLYSCVGRKQTKVNSIHKQSINLIGDGLTVTAAENNKIIQCIEDRKLSFVMGVQFHPEFLIFKKSFLNIFKQFIKMAMLRKHHQAM